MSQRPRRSAQPKPFSLGEYEDDYESSSSSAAPAADVDEYGSDFEAGVEELEGAVAEAAKAVASIPDHHPEDDDDHDDDDGLHHHVGEDFHSADEEMNHLTEQEDRKQGKASRGSGAAGGGASFGTTATIWHPTSKYQEPLFQDMSHRPLWWPVLSLYELHRKPRQVVRGRWQCPSSMHQILDAFRCVICWSTMKKPKAVRECMHRFCDECITTALRMGKNECPFCRVFVPSKRNLAVDESVEIMIENVLGPELRTLEETELEDDAKDGATGTDKDDADDEQGYHSSLRRRRTKRIPNYAERPFKRRKADYEDNNQDEAYSPSGDPYAESKKDNDEGVAEEEYDNDDLDDDDEEEDSSPPSLVEFTLAPQASEKRLAPLVRPYIRISGDATIGTLIKFLQAKLAYSSEIQMMYTMSSRTPIPSKTPLAMLGALRTKLFYRTCPRPYKPRGSSKPPTGTMAPAVATAAAYLLQQQQQQHHATSSVTHAALAHHAVHVPPPRLSYTPESPGDRSY